MNHGSTDPTVFAWVHFAEGSLNSGDGRRYIFSWYQTYAFFNGYNFYVTADGKLGLGVFLAADAGGGRDDRICR